MIDWYVYQGPRQCGKTFTLMGDIYEAIQDGGTVLVVLPTFVDTKYWLDAWKRRFMAVPTPRCVSWGSIDRVRGLQLSDIYVENVDYLDEGIYDPRFSLLMMSLRGGHHQNITVTSGYQPRNLDAY